MVLQIVLLKTPGCINRVTFFQPEKIKYHHFEKFLAYMLLKFTVCIEIPFPSLTNQKPRYSDILNTKFSFLASVCLKIGYFQVGHVFDVIEYHGLAVCTYLNMFNKQTGENREEVKSDIFVGNTSYNTYGVKQDRE